jgi:hypothetical protein
MLSGSAVSDSGAPASANSDRPRRWGRNEDAGVADGLAAARVDDVEAEAGAIASVAECVAAGATV